MRAWKPIFRDLPAATGPDWEADPQPSRPHLEMTPAPARSSTPVPWETRGHNHPAKPNLSSCPGERRESVSVGLQSRRCCRSTGGPVCPCHSYFGLRCPETALSAFASPLPMGLSAIFKQNFNTKLDSCIVSRLCGHICQINS